MNREPTGYTGVSTGIRALAPRLLLWTIALILLGVGIVRAEEPLPQPRPSNLYLPLLAVDSSPRALTATGSWSAPIAVDPLSGAVWVVNPDADSVTTFHPHSPEHTTEIATGAEPWALAVAPDGQTVYVVNRAAGTLSYVDARLGREIHEMPIGPEPIGLALSPSGRTGYISLLATDQVLVLDLQQRAISARIPVGPKPYAVAVTHKDGGEDADQQILVTHLLARQRPGAAPATDDGAEAVVTRIDAGAHRVIDEIVLEPTAHGFPNLLTGLALGARRAWVPHVAAAPDSPVGLTTTVFAGVAGIDYAEGLVDPAAYLPLNDQEIFGSPVNNPVATIPSPDGAFLYVVLAGSDLLEVVDISRDADPRLVGFVPVGRNPRGMALSPDGRLGYVMNYLSRSVTVVDLQALVPLEEVAVVAETLPPDVLRGKILFNNASDPRLSQGSWISCASCHVDGLPDGVTWIFPDGPRQTPALWRAGETLPWHWSAALDEPQDVEETIHSIQHGLGLAPGADAPQLGRPNGGRSVALDDLAAFLTRGIRSPALAPAASDADAGRALFADLGCAGCHGGPQWTISRLPGAVGSLDPDGNGQIDGVLRDVGTAGPHDRRGANGFDVPALLGVALTAPYLHDGSIASLTSLLLSGHPAPENGAPQLTHDQLEYLVAFLHSIDGETEPLPDSRSVEPAGPAPPNSSIRSFR